MDYASCCAMVAAARDQTTAHFKIYKNSGPLEQISTEEANRLYAEGQARFGYIRYNFNPWYMYKFGKPVKEWVPGTEQRKIPIETPGEYIQRTGA
jgi:hypothetical protein